VQLEVEQRKAKINCLFRIEYADFKDGLPLPENRIKAMGWRLAKQEQLNYDIALETAYECFGELNRGDIY
jgi:hypothetical protein